VCGGLREGFWTAPAPRTTAKHISCPLRPEGTLLFRARALVGSVARAQTAGADSAPAVWARATTLWERRQGLQRGVETPTTPKSAGALQFAPGGVRTFLRGRPMSASPLFNVFCSHAHTPRSFLGRSTCTKLRDHAARCALLIALARTCGACVYPAQQQRSCAFLTFLLRGTHVPGHPEGGPQRPTAGAALWNMFFQAPNIIFMERVGHVPSGVQRCGLVESRPKESRARAARSIHRRYTEPASEPKGITCA